MLCCQKDLLPSVFSLYLSVLCKSHVAFFAVALEQKCECLFVLIYSSCTLLGASWLALRLKAVPKQCDFCLHNKKTPLSLVLRFNSIFNHLILLQHHTLADRCYSTVLQYLQQLLSLSWVIIKADHYFLSDYTALIHCIDMNYTTHNSGLTRRGMVIPMSSNCHSFSHLLLEATL